MPSGLFIFTLAPFISYGGVYIADLLDWRPIASLFIHGPLRGPGRVSWRWIDAAILRTSMGSSVQLPTYNWTKNQLTSRGILPEKSIWTYLVSSSVSGLCVVCYSHVDKFYFLKCHPAYCDATCGYGTLLVI